MVIQAKTMDVKTMDVKKTQEIAPSGVSSGPSNSGKKAQEFIGDVKAELTKISWTSPDELKAYTKIVVGATFLFGMGIYILDLIIQVSLGILESGLRLLSG